MLPSVCKPNICVSHWQFIVQVHKQENPTALHIYYQQLGLSEEISATVEKSARSSITDGKEPEIKDAGSQAGRQVGRQEGRKDKTRQKSCKNIWSKLWGSISTHLHLQYDLVICNFTHLWRLQSEVVAISYYLGCKSKILTGNLNYSYE